MDKYRWLVHNFPADAESHQQFVNMMCDLAYSKAHAVYYRLPNRVMVVTWLRIEVV